MGNRKHNENLFYIGSLNMNYVQLFFKELKNSIVIEYYTNIFIVTYCLHDYNKLLIFISFIS